MLKVKSPFKYFHSLIRQSKRSITLFNYYRFNFDIFTSIIYIIKIKTMFL